MKKLSAAFIGILTVHYSLAQTNTFPTNGNVGLGVTYPTSKLTVDGDIKLNNRGQALLVDYASFSETKNAATTIVGNNVKAGEGLQTVRRFVRMADPGSFIALNYYYGITFHAGIATPLNIDQSERNNEVMRITNAGDVGIGTPYPGAKLAVNGNIRAREIKVEHANWPDYVFLKDYELLPLAEIESHLKSKGHLPGIPSSAQVKANGIDLGDMNARLLQKIEELTLHLIEKEKNEKLIVRRLDALEKQLKKSHRKLLQPEN